MKIVAINGSPHGRVSNTGVMVSAFLKGAEEAGAETKQLYLAEKAFEYCRGCHSCWTKTPGKCVIQDEMPDVLSAVAGANVFVLASPVHFANISGQLKVFMDRLTVIGSPHPRKSADPAVSNSTASENKTPKLLMISNCGFPDRSQFQVISLWIKQVASMMHTDLIGEIYAPQGRFLTATPSEQRRCLADYLQLLQDVGKETATCLRLSETTVNLLKQQPVWEHHESSVRP